MVGEIFPIILTKLSCKLVPTHKRRIPHNRRKPRHLSLPHKHLWELQRPVERPSPLQQLIHLISQLFESVAKLLLALFCESLVASFFVASCQNEIASLHRILKHTASL